MTRVELDVMFDEIARRHMGNKWYSLDPIMVRKAMFEAYFRGTQETKQHVDPQTRQALDELAGIDKELGLYP